MFKLKLVFYFFSISASTIFAQISNDTLIEDNNISVYQTLKSDAVTFYNVGLNFFQSPLHFDNSDLYLTGAILGITAASLPLDQPI